LGDELKKDEIDTTCITYERNEKCKQNLIGILEGKVPFDDVDVFLRIPVKRSQEI
jgi:hypothetical protein